MGRFNGNNGQGALRQFLERSNFSAAAYGEEYGQPYPRPVKDFNFGEKGLYGRIDKMHNPIQLKTLNLAPLENQPSDGRMLQSVDFVADAFKEFMVQWRIQGIRGRLDESDPILFEIVPQRAYVDYRQSYTKYQISLREAFMNVYLTKERKDSIINFETFMKLFVDYLLEISPTVPITKTAFMPSKFAGPMVSGLCIEVGKFDASNDANKERFINSPNFAYYKLVAIATGFSIDKQAPWRLVADIASPQMLAFAARYGQNSERRILKNYYGRTGGTDITDLQRMAIDFYETLLRGSPRIRTKASLGCPPDAGYRYITRTPITAANVLATYPVSFWLDKYITIRYNEQRMPLSEGGVSEVRKTSRRLLQATASELQALTYVNNHIKTFDNFKGSYVRRVLDRRNAANGTDTQPTY